MSAYPSGTVTLLFTDIEGSTLLLQRLGAQYGEVLTAHRRLLRESFERAGGHEIDTQGDSFFVAFARARDALEAAVEAQRRVAQEQWPEGADVRVRVGVHTGEPAIGDEGYLGLDVHRAARICAAAHGGQILLSQTTRDLCTEVLPPETQLEDLGEHRLKDLPRPEHIFQLVVPGLPSVFPPLHDHDRQEARAAAFLGRERELASLAMHAVSAAGGRVARKLIRHGTAGRRGFADYGWDVRGLVPSAPEPLQNSLSAFGGDLFALGRTAADYERYLASVDRRRFERRRRELREMAVTSRRAAAEADSLDGRLTQFDALVAQRARLESVAAEVDAAIERIRHNVHGGELDAVRADTGALRALVQAAERDLHAQLEDVHAALGDLGVAPKRTRHRGVFRLGGRYVVPFFNELGIEERRQFSSLDEAQAFRQSVRLVEAEHDEERTEANITGIRQWGGEQGLIPPRRDRR